MKEELLMAKQILKDPTLSRMATTKFHHLIDKVNDDKICTEGAIITDLLET